MTTFNPQLGYRVTLDGREVLKGSTLQKPKVTKQGGLLSYKMQ